MIYVPYLKRSLSGELYLRFEGNFNDSSLAARTVTDNGASRSTDHPGGGSEALEGNGSGYLTVVDDGAFDIGGRIFQLRFHLYIESTATLNTPDNIVVGKWGTVDGSWFINVYGASGTNPNFARLELGRRSSGTYFFNSWAPDFLPTNTLMQVTVWRPVVNSDVYMAIDGVVIGNIGSATVFDSTSNNLGIASVVGGGAILPVGVHVDELQFKIDETEYGTSDFTPPTPPYS